MDKRILPFEPHSPWAVQIHTLQVVKPGYGALSYYTLGTSLLPLGICTLAGTNRTEPHQHLEQSIKVTKKCLESSWQLCKACSYGMVGGESEHHQLCSEHNSCFHIIIHSFLKRQNNTFLSMIVCPQIKNKTIGQQQLGATNSFRPQAWGKHWTPLPLPTFWDLTICTESCAEACEMQEL